MTDWTTPEDVPTTTVERLHRWLLQEGNPEDAATPGERAVADIIRTFWPVPPRTLAEGLEYRADLLDNGDPDGDTANALRTLATDAIQMEHELAEARAEVERVRAVVDPEGAGLPPGMTISEAVQILVDGIPTGEHEGLTAEQWKREYDLARAEVERLTAVAEDYARRATAALTERDEARAEVETLALSADSSDQWGRRNEP